MRDLLELRDEIDCIDEQIVQLYEDRMKISEQVAEYKISTGKKVFDKEREVSKLKTLSGLAHTTFTKHGVRELFEQIMAMSRKKQYQLLTQHGLTEQLDFKEVDGIDYSNARIVFQGVDGANSQMAMKEYFGENANSFHVDTFRDAMEAIQNGSANYAVLPIENSSAGFVTQSFDLLVEYDACIVGEQIIKIDHALLGVKGATKEEISIVYSHPQALMQCSDYLESHPNWSQKSFVNTATAAKKVMEDSLKNQAAIANIKTADIYGLDVLEDTIQDNKDNYTRFIIVTSQKIFEKKAGKVSICFEIPHESGSLYHMLSHFIYNDLNMVKIESRPIKEKAWEYRFFIDFEGNLNDGAVTNALRGLSEECNNLKILGNY